MSRFSAYDPTSCLNCGEQFDPTTKFCPSCGQKNRKNELKLLEWIREGVSTFLHLEGRTWNTIRDLVTPGKIAINYFNGHRKRYVHPFRLLVFSSLICFGLISISKYYYPDADRFDIVTINKGNQNDTKRKEEGSYSSPDIITDVDMHPMAGQMKYIDLLRAKFISYDRFALIADSMRRAGASQDSAQLALLDTLGNFYSIPTENLLGDNGYINLAGEDVIFDKRSIASHSPAKVVENAKVKGWLPRLIGKKVIGAFQEGSETLAQQLFSNLSWAVLLYVPLLALGYFVFYRRRLTMYTQHLTYSAILMSIALLAFGFGSLFDSILGIRIASPIFLLLFVGYNFVSDIRVFEVSTLHAFSKFSILGIYGFLAFTIALLAWLFGTLLFL